MPAQPLPQHDGQPNWDERAACRGEDPSLFFGPNRFEPKRERLAREDAAKQVCSGCAVVAPCRQFAIDTAEYFGVWGGLGEAERRALIDRRQATGTKRAG